MKSFVLVVAVATLLAGCGGSDSSSSDTTVPAADSTTTAVAAAPVVDTAVDKAHAERLILTAADVPAGWTPDLEEDPADAAKTDELERKLGACTGDADPAASVSAQADGQSFSNGNNTISSVGVLYKTAEIAKASLASGRDQKNFPCIGNVFSDFFKQTFADQGVTGVSTSSEVSLLDTIDIGSDGFALRITTKVTGPAGSANIYMDLVGYVKDRAEASVLLTYASEAPPVSLEREMLAKLRARADAAVTV